MVTISVSSSARSHAAASQSTLTSTSSGNKSADAGAAVVIAHAIAHPTTARATFSLASSIHDVEFARAVTVRRARRPLVVEFARDDVDARGRIVVVIPACVIVLDVVPRARVANTDVRRSSFATEIESRRRVVVSRATTGRPTSSRRRSRSERIHARRPTNTYVSLPLCTECPIFSLSLSFTTPHPLATRREDEQKTKKNEKKNEKTDDTDETKRNGRKRSGWDDDPSRARGEEIARSSRARAMEGVRRAERHLARGAETNRDLFGRVRGRCARCDECPGGYLKRANEYEGKTGGRWSAESGERHPENDATLMNCSTCGCPSDAHEIDECADWRERGNDAFADGRYEDAAACFTAALEVNRGDAKSFSNRSACFMKMRKFSQALSDGERAVELEGNWAKARSRVGAANMALGGERRQSGRLNSR